MYPLCSARGWVGSKDDFPAVDQQNFFIRYFTYPDLWTLEVRHDAQVKFIFLIDGRDMVDDGEMFFVRTMGKIEPEDVYARFSEVKKSCE